MNDFGAALFEPKDKMLRLKSVRATRPFQQAARREVNAGSSTCSQVPNARMAPDANVNR
jgi:hypothetical protein